MPRNDGLLFSFSEKLRLTPRLLSPRRRASLCSTTVAPSPAMHSLFHSNAQETVPAVESVLSEFPVIDGAEIAAVTYGARVAGDFYDSLRVSPARILFGLLDVAGRRENNQPVLTAAQDRKSTRL